jgi:hypothetical protein
LKDLGFLGIAGVIAARSLSLSGTCRIEVGIRACVELEGLGAGAELIAFEFEVEAAARKTELPRGARDVATVFAQGVCNHAALYFCQSIGERHVLQSTSGH